MAIVFSLRGLSRAFPRTTNEQLHFLFLDIDCAPPSHQFNLRADRSLLTFRARGKPLIERYFQLAQNQTSVKQELLGGLTTFVTMAYIVVVNPQILSQAGMPADGVVFATCLSSAVATLVMGLYANYPIALAPGMSLNAYFTYSVCLAMHIPWQTALAVVCFSGVLFLILTVTRLLKQIVNGIPDCLKHSTAAGIGMFIAFVGLRNAKLVVANPATLVTATPGDVSMYSINASTGALTSIGTISAGMNPVRVTVDPSGRFAYVGNVEHYPNSVSVYTIDTTSGVLTSVGTAPAGGNFQSLAVHPSGRPPWSGLPSAITGEQGER